MSGESHFTAEEATEIGGRLGIDWKAFDVDQFRRGLDVELEHGLVDPATNVSCDDPLTTGKIALAHLKEFPDYYDRLHEMEEEAEAFWRGGSEPAAEAKYEPSSQVEVAQPCAEPEHTEQESTELERDQETMTDYLQRADAPFGSEVWGLIDNTVAKAAGSQLTVRKIVSVLGPFGAGFTQIPGKDEMMDPGEGVMLAAGTAVPLVQLSSSFSLAQRDLASFRASGIAPDLSDVARAAMAMAAQEDKLLLQGVPRLGLPGLMTADGVRKITLGDWSNVGTAADNVIEAVSVLDRAGFHGPYSLALSPDSYNLLFRRYPTGSGTELDHLRQIVTGALVKAPALPTGGVLIADGPQFVAIVVGQDLQTGFVGPTADMGYEFTISETLALRVNAPEAICLLEVV